MQRTLFGFIVSYSLRQQALLLGLIVASLPFYYVSLDLPKRIVNQVIGGVPGDFPRPAELFGLRFGSFEQIELLLVLSGLFLALVFVNGGFKYTINVFKGLLGERMLRRLRYQLFTTILRFPLPHFRNVSEGEMVSMIASEVESLGGFIGDAFATPLYQGGLLLTALGFIFAQDPIMGLAVIALYPVQAAIIPRLQSQVNVLGRARIREVRALSNKIDETIGNARAVRLDDTVRYEQADITARLGRIFAIRYRIYRKKFFIKFLNNFLAQLTPFLFFSIGGWLVIEDRLSLGALVAVLAAYKDLAPPWKELLDYYQDQQDARIKYEQIRVQFDVGEEGERPEPEAPPLPAGPLPIEMRDVTLRGDGVARLNGVSLDIGANEHVALAGPADGGDAALASLLVRLHRPDGGTVRLGGEDLFKLPRAAVARYFAYVDDAPSLVTGTLWDNLVYPLRRAPRAPETAMPAVAAARAEALAAGNSPDDAAADWIDYAQAGVAGADELRRAAVETLEHVGLGAALLRWGLMTRVSAEADPELARRLLEARSRLAPRLSAPPLADAVAPFDAARFNPNLSIAENLIFAASVPGGPVVADLAEDRFVRHTLDREALTEPLVSLGLTRARAWVLEVGGGAPPMAPPVGPDEEPALRQTVVEAARHGERALSRSDRRRLLRIALASVPSRDLAEPPPTALQTGLVAARGTLAQTLPVRLRATIRPFAADAYNDALTIEENVEFGRANRAQAETVREAVCGALEELGLVEAVREAGLAFQVGPRGARLVNSERRRLALAQALLRQPGALVLSGALAGLDRAEQAALIRALREALRGRQLVCTLEDVTLGPLFDRMILLRDGAVVPTPEAPSQAALS